MSREVHVRFCEGLGVQLPRSTHVVVHCSNEKQAKYILTQITRRLYAFKLQVHPDKTKIVYCKQEGRQDDYPITAFDFLGYTFRPRSCRTKEGRMFLGYGPAISANAEREIRQDMRSLRLSRHTSHTLEEIAEIVNPKVRGWIQYYGKFYKTELIPTLAMLNRILLNWVMKKYKRLHRKPAQARHWLIQTGTKKPDLFAHWSFGVKPNRLYGIMGAV